MAQLKRSSTADEAALIDFISAEAAVSAGQEPTVEVFRDIESIRPMRQSGPQPETFGGKPKTVRDLLTREEDGFIEHIRVSIVRGATKQGRRVAVILEPFAFVHRVEDLRVAVIAPVRYETDFASIPGWARGVIAPFGIHAEAAVVHDWLYAMGEEGDERGRWIADSVFREALRHLGVGWMKRLIMYFAVRGGGKKAYGRADEFRFRHLKDMTPVDPPPSREPYAQTIAIAYLAPDAEEV